MIKKISDYIQNNFSTVFLVLVIVALLRPSLLSPLKNQADILLMGALFLGYLKIEFGEFSHLKANAKKIVALSVISVTVLPLFVFLLVFWLPLPMALGLTMIAAAPGAMMSPLIAGMWNLRVLWTSIYVILTSTLLPLTFPYVIQILFGSKVEIPILSISIFLAKMIILPSIFAFALKKISSTLAKKTAENSGAIGSLCIALFVAIIVASNRNFLLENFTKLQTFASLGMMILLFLFCFLVGYLIPAKEKREKLTNCLMFGCMNNGIVIIAASKFFSPEVQLVLLLSEVPWSFSLPLFKKFLDKGKKISNSEGDLWKSNKS